MAWYDGTHSCGHAGRINVIGPGRDRQWRVDRHFEGLCEECYAAKVEADREAARQDAAQKAAEMELPELTGSEKQIAWALTIRQALIDEAGKLQDQYPDGKDAIAKVLMFVLQKHTAASYYIDNRDTSALRWLETAAKTMPMDGTNAPATEAKAVEAEATIYPEEAKTPLVAKVVLLEGSRIEVRYPEKNEDLRTAVKALGFAWDDGCWARKIGKYNGPIADRAAEVSAKLLSIGIPVCVLDEAIRAKAVSGEYEPECKRWITKLVGGKYADWFAVNWDRNADDFYSAARALPGSRWESPRVVVPPQSFAEVLDFADMYQFKLSEGAKEVVDNAAKLRDQALVATPSGPSAHELPAPLCKPPVLAVPTEVSVDEDLRDTD